MRRSSEQFVLHGISDTIRLKMTWAGKKMTQSRKLGALLNVANSRYIRKNKNKKGYFEPIHS